MATAFTPTVFAPQGKADYRINPVAGVEYKPQDGMTQLNQILDYQGKQLDLTSKQELLQPKIEAGKAESKKVQLEAQKAGVDLNQHFENIKRSTFGGFLTDPDFIDGNKEAMKKKIEASNEYLKSIGVPEMNAGKSHDEFLKLIDTDPKQAYQAMKTGVLQANGPQSELNQTTPQYTTNAAGQIVGLTTGTNQISQPSGGQGGQNLSPSTPSVQNFGDYQKDLTSRVAAGTQIDMRLNEAEDLMKSFKPGAGARTYVDLAQKLQAIGAPRDLVDKVAKGDLSAAQSMNNFIAQSITAGIGQMQGNPTANMMNDYLKNNPDIASDPRALQRFFNFAHKQNEMAYEEQNYLTNKIRSRELNPETHVAETQQHILNKFVRPQGTKEQSNRQVVRTGKTKSGQKVVEYSDGTREIQ